MTDFFISLIKFTLDTDMNGEKTNSKSLFIHRVFTVETHKSFTSGWFKTAQGGNLGLVAL